MKAHLLAAVVGVSLGFIAACGNAGDDSGMSSPDSMKTESFNECPCGSAGGGSCLPCMYICGDNFCDSSNGESAANCPEDCTVTPWCGDGLCNGGENSSSCPADCGPSTWCGDGICNGGETAGSCPMDCGSASCGDGLCDINEMGWCFIDCQPGCTVGTCPEIPHG